MILKQGQKLKLDLKTIITKQKDNSKHNCDLLCPSIVFYENLRHYNASFNTTRFC